MPQVIGLQYDIVIIQYISMEIKNMTQPTGSPNKDERKHDEENEENVL